MDQLELTRRGFLGWSAVGVGSLLSAAGKSFGAVAGPFAWGDDFPIPADKKFTAEWIASLTARGTATVYSSVRDELKYIGMPVGGLCCGQVYLSGDGRVWHWDIFNLQQAPEWCDCAGALYSKPAVAASPFKNGFGIAYGTAEGGGKPAWKTLDTGGFKDIEFQGQYPIGVVSYREQGCPVEVELEAFSPFCPLDVEESSLPAVVVHYTVKNTGGETLAVSLTGHMQNPVCLGTGKQGDVTLVTRAVKLGAGVGVVHAAEAVPEETRPKSSREDIVIEDWEKGTYDGWTVTGKAFGDRPRNVKDMAGYQGDVNAQGEWLVNTHESRHGEDVVKADSYVGTLTGKEFTIERDWIRFRIDGGNHPGQTCVNLLVDGAPVRTETGKDSNRMRLAHWDVRDLKGKTARLQVVDGWTGGWGQIGIDEIVQTDSDRLERYDFDRAPDSGSMALVSRADASCICKGELKPGAEARTDVNGRETATVTSTATIGPGQSKTFSFVLAWHFPNPPREQLAFLKDIKTLKHHYAARFKNAEEVAAYVLSNLDGLTRKTRLWRDTWYDSTLPYWFLDRSFATVSTAATATCYRFDNGRFYGWEGAYSCAGTCTHVWQYGQALGRVFPALERSLRERIDFDQEFEPKTGLIHYRGEAARELAIDGQCGTIVRAWREHTMCRDDSFLKKVFPNVRKAMEMVIARDDLEDGILDGAQYNTLDTTWYGKIAWISSLYLAALRATAAMAEEAGDPAFAQRCTQIADRGRKNMVEQLFNGEYFVHQIDPKHPETNATGTGCHADQLLGQGFAWQMGLPRIVPREQAVSALKSIYTYCLATDIGPYRKKSEETVKGGRWFALPGEPGLLLCTWPKGGSEAATAKGRDAWAVEYFNESWTGFEHQVASHMIFEGLVQEGLAIDRIVHDRHHAAKRNPYNEVECGNHYARAMSGYGSFVAACGFAHHGPAGKMGFDPRVFGDKSKPDFAAAFIGAEGWGRYSQSREKTGSVHEIDVRHGSLRLAELRLPQIVKTAKSVRAIAGGRAISAKISASGDQWAVKFEVPLEVKAGSKLQVAVQV